MFKKIILLLVVFAFIPSLVACGNNNLYVDAPNTPDEQNTQTSRGDNFSEGKKDNDSANVDLSQTYAFMGYNIAYPSDANDSDSDYGSLIGTSDYCLVVEAPSTAGIMLETNNINDAPSMCEKYIFETLEHDVRSLFDFDSTSQNIKDSTVITYNGIEMLMVKGTFTNEEKKREVDFSAIYLLAGDNGNLPVYIVGIPMTENYDVSKIVDAIAKNIKK